jgi:lipopolysaccharide exporter
MVAAHAFWSRFARCSMVTGSAGTRAAGGAAWSIILSSVARALGLVGTLVIVRYLSPDDYGEASAASALVTTTAQAATLGVGMYVVANRDVSRSDVFHATLIHLATGALGVVFLLTIGRRLGALFDAPGFGGYVTGLTFSMVLDRVSFMPERILVRAMRFRAVAMTRALSEIAFSAASVGLAYRGWGVSSIVIGSIARSAVRAAGPLILVSWRDWIEVTRVRWSLIKQLCTYGFTVTLMGFAALSSRRWDNLLVSRYFGPGVLGSYNLAYNLADMPAVNIGEQITDVLFSYYARVEGADRHRVRLRALGLVALIMFPASVGLGAIAPTLTTVFLQARWSSVGTMLMILSTMSVTRPVSMTVGAFLVVERGPGIAALVEVTHLAVLMAAIATVGRLSPLSTCVAVGVVFAARTLAVIWLTQAGNGRSVWEMLARLTGPSLASVPMAAVVLLLPYLLGEYGAAHPVVKLVLQILAGVAVYLPAAFLLAPVDSRELIALARRVLAQRLAPKKAASV